MTLYKLLKSCKYSINLTFLTKNIEKRHKNGKFSKNTIFSNFTLFYVFFVFNA